MIPGFEHRFNRAFAIHDEEALVSAMLRDLPPAPADAGLIRATNPGRRAA